MTALYLERYMNFGLALEELQSGRPIIGIAQTGSDLSPCNRHHLVLAERIRAGIIEAGGIPLEFPVHPIQETGKRPTAGLDRNLAYLDIPAISFYEVDPLRCRHCGGTMQLIAFIVESAVIVRLLDHLGEPSRALRRASIRGPPWAHECWDAIADSDNEATYPNPATQVMPDYESQRQDLSW